MLMVCRPVVNYFCQMGNPAKDTTKQIRKYLNVNNPRWQPGVDMPHRTFSPAGAISLVNILKIAYLA